MGLVRKALRGLFCLLLLSLVADCVPLSPRTFASSSSWSGQVQKDVKQDPVLPSLPPPRTVAVRCHESAVEIAVKADMFGTGVVIDGADLRLGWNPLVKGAQPEAKCGAVATGEGEYVILAELTDCGTELLFTDEWLVYRNSLFYSPPLVEGIIRLEEIVIPIECYYGRQYSVDSKALVPTWVPFSDQQSAEDAFEFTLRLLTADWSSERTSNVYFLGDLVHLEASVVQGNHVPLRVFVDTCMATLVPDVNSDPRYAFIENGCFTDAIATGSRSHFLPRIQDHNLHVVLDAFRMYQDSRDSIYITCLVKAEPAALGIESPSRACSYIGGRWMSADGNDQTCGSCDSSQGFSSGKKTTDSKVWKRATKADTASEKIVTIGPLVFLEPERTDTPEVLVAEPSGTSVGTQAIVAVESAAPSPSVVPTEAGTVVDASMTLQQSKSMEDPAVVIGQEEASSASLLPLTGRSADSKNANLAFSLEARAVVDEEAGTIVDKEEGVSGLLVPEKNSNLQTGADPSEPDRTSVVESVEGPWVSW